MRSARAQERLEQQCRELASAVAAKEDALAQMQQEHAKTARAHEAAKKMFDVSVCVWCALLCGVLCCVVCCVLCCMERVVLSVCCVVLCV